MSSLAPANHISNDCFHCGEPIKGNQQWLVIIDGIDQPMCCPGCKAVAETIVASGLKDYYRHRTELPDLSPAEDDVNELAVRESLQLYDSEALQRRFVAHSTDYAEATLIIDGISCAACSWLIEHRISQLNGVINATLNLSNHRLVVRWQYSDIRLSQIIEAIYRLGYKASPFSATEQEATQAREGKQAIRRLAVAGIGTMQVMMMSVPLYVGMATQYEIFMRFAAMIMTLPVVLFGARPFFDAAMRSLRSGHLTMDVPVSLAIVLAFCASVWSTFNQGIEVYFDSVCMFTFFLLLGRFLEMRARHRMGKAGNNLMTLLPNVALKLASITDQNEQIIATEDIRIGDILRLKPGHPIPADGIVVEGYSSVDEAALTGEYLPISKAPGATLIGGTVNVESPMLMEVTATGAEAQLSTIMRLMDRAQQEKPQIALLADRIASRFVAAVLIISGSVFGYWWFATPTALTAATTALREQGILISKGHVLETLTTIQRVVFDKTGTLTQGRLTLERVETLTELPTDDAIALVATLEQHATHPIALAFTSIAAESQIQASNVRHHPSQGVSGKINGRTLRFGRADFAWSDAIEHPHSDTGQWLLLADEEQPLAWFLLNDSVRRSAEPVIKALKARGIKVSLLTGDPSPAALTIAASLGIDDVRSGVSPAEKLLAVRHWQQQGERVMMVGDGINDVPVLAGADVSLAVNDASDLAKTNADMLLTNGRLEATITAFDVARRTRLIIRENIGWALLYNLIALPLAAAGLIPPWAAAIGMSFSSLLVVFNALRLIRHRSLSLNEA